MDGFSSSHYDYFYSRILITFCFSNTTATNYFIIFLRTVDVASFLLVFIYVHLDITFLFTTLVVYKKICISNISITQPFFSFYNSMVEEGNLNYKFLCYKY